MKLLSYTLLAFSIMPIVGCGPGFQASSHRHSLNSSPYNNTDDYDTNYKYHTGFSKEVPAPQEEVTAQDEFAPQNEESLDADSPANTSPNSTSTQISSDKKTSPQSSKETANRVEPDITIRVSPKHDTSSHPKTIQVPYTTAGGEEYLNNIRNEVKNNSDDHLARSIIDVTVTTLNDKNIVTSTQPTQLMAKIIFKKNPTGAQTNVKSQANDTQQTNDNSNEEINFIAPLIKSNNLLIANNVAEKSGKKTSPSFTANFKCFDQNCQKLGILIKETSNAVAKQIGILYQSTDLNLITRKESPETIYKSADFRALEFWAKDKNPKIRQTSVSILNGPSFMNLEAANYFSIQTDLLDTAYVSTKVNKIKIFNNTSFSANVIGNDLHGDTIIDVDDNMSRETIRLIFTKDSLVDSVNDDSEEQTSEQTQSNTNNKKAEAKRSKNLGPKPVQTKEALFPVTIDSRNLPNTLRVSQAFANYADDKVVQQFIKNWLCESKCRSSYNLNKLKNFLTYSPPLVPYLKAITEKFDVTPEIGYILLFESSYPSNPNYPTFERPAGPKATDLGPWQFVYSTAATVRRQTGVPFQIYKTTTRPNPNDDRTYFLNSTYMATLNLRTLFDQYKSDPALAILAYRSGGTAYDITKKITRFSPTLKEILKYRIQTKTNKLYLDYTFAFLAAREIGQNRETYGLENIPVTTSEKYKERLYRKGGPLPPNLNL